MTPSGQSDLGMTSLGQPDLGMTPSLQSDLGMTPSGQSDLGMTPSGQSDLGMTSLGQPDLGMTLSGQSDLGMTLYYIFGPKENFEEVLMTMKKLLLTLWEKGESLETILFSLTLNVFYPIHAVLEIFPSGVNLHSILSQACNYGIVIHY